MDYIQKAKAWIIRQAKQPTSWGGTLLATLALVWQFAGQNITLIVNNAAPGHPIINTIAKLAIGVIGLVCIVYNENKSTTDNSLDNQK